MTKNFGFPKENSVLGYIPISDSVLHRQERYLHSKVSEAFEGFFAQLSVIYGFDLNDPNFTDTPSRVTKSFDEFLVGYRQNPEDILKVDFPADDYDQMIIVKDIDYYSLCAHHMLPFHGKLAVAYIPEGGRVVGLSKIVRLCQVFTRRLQLQERLTMQIAKAIDKNLKPKGVGVLAYSTDHFCMKMRGVKSHTSTVTTSALLGEFRTDSDVRKEFLALVK